MRMRFNGPHYFYYLPAFLDNMLSECPCPGKVVCLKLKQAMYILASWIRLCSLPRVFVNRDGNRFTRDILEVS